MYAKGTLTIVDNREQLKIKVNSLAEESRIIRRAERKTRGPIRESLYLHRIRDVREESRSAGLALGFIKGRTWEEMEKSPFTLPDWNRVKTLIAKYGPRDKAKLAAFDALTCFEIDKYAYEQKQMKRRAVKQTTVHSA